MLTTGWNIDLLRQATYAATKYLSAAQAGVDAPWNNPQPVDEVTNWWTERNRLNQSNLPADELRNRLDGLSSKYRIKEVREKAIALMKETGFQPAGATPSEAWQDYCRLLQKPQPLAGEILRSLQAIQQPDNSDRHRYSVAAYTTLLIGFVLFKIGGEAAILRKEEEPEKGDKPIRTLFDTFDALLWGMLDTLTPDMNHIFRLAALPDEQQDYAEAMQRQYGIDAEDFATLCMLILFDQGNGIALGGMMPLFLSCFADWYKHLYHEQAPRLNPATVESHLMMLSTRKLEKDAPFFRSHPAARTRIRIA